MIEKQCNKSINIKNYYNNLNLLLRPDRICQNLGNLNANFKIFVFKFGQFKNSL